MLRRDIGTAPVLREMKMQLGRNNYMRNDQGQRKMSWEQIIAFLGLGKLERDGDE